MKATGKKQNSMYKVKRQRSCTTSKKADKQEKRRTSRLAEKYRRQQVRQRTAYSGGTEMQPAGNRKRRRQ
jgi:hypothetical protein